jgi:FMN phosphatase YigB (HAD superfamily)
MIDFNRITHIVFDADDTLWQNHVFYADLIAMFADHLALVCGKDAGSLEKRVLSFAGTCRDQLWLWHDQFRSDTAKVI